jgi:CheY-like chemotaxis protein
MESTSASESAKTSNRYLILIVDDEPCLRMLVREYLEREGFRVVEAANGQEAIDAVKNERPRLIFMNYLMPVMDGLEASRIIHDDPELSYIPIILNSACDEDEMTPLAKDAGCVDFFGVPFSPRELLKRVMMHILVG